MLMSPSIVDERHVPAVVLRIAFVYVISAVEPPAVQFAAKPCIDGITSPGVYGW